jgi:hypothetical protein
MSQESIISKPRGGIVLFPLRFVARGEPRRRGQACPGRLTKETLSPGLNNGLNKPYKFVRKIT